MRHAEQLKSIYKNWERRVREEGREEGIEQGMREALVSAYRARFGAVPSALQTAVEAVSDVPTLRRWLPVFTTASDEDIAAAVHPRAPKRTRATATGTRTGTGSRVRGRKPTR